MENRFNISFFELAFLVESCIPPVPIARYSLFIRVIDEIYYKLTDDERENLFIWIRDEPRFSLENKDCKLFYDRYDPTNQYLVTLIDNEKERHCFLHENNFHISSNSRINDNFIIKTEKYKKL